jgi:hypothetical protein
MEDFATLSTVSGASAGGFESIWMAFAQSERVERLEAVDAIEASSHDYHPELAMPELIVQIRRLLAAERRVGRLVCRYLADLADRIQAQRDRELLADVDEFRAAAHFFGLGAREARERVRIGRALRQLPQIEAAFIAGELSYSRVREVTRVARPGTESAWLECARDLDMRTLERRVAGTADELARRHHLDETTAESHCAPDALATFDVAGAHFDEATAESRAAADGRIEAFDAASAHAPSSTRHRGAAERASRLAPGEQARMRTRWLDRDSLRVTFELPAEVWALLERALDGARQRAATPLADAEALAAVVRDALASQNQAADASDGRRPDDARETLEAGHAGDDECAAALRRAEGHAGDMEYPAAPARREPSECAVSAARAKQQDNEPDNEPDIDDGATHLGALNDKALRLLQIMGRRGSWTSDLLFERSALPFPELQHALLLLELDGRVRRRGCKIDPV